MSVPAAKARPPAPVMISARTLPSVGDGGADLAQPVVHVEGQRVVRLRPVERDDADGALHLVKQVSCHLISHPFLEVLLCS